MIELTELDKSLLRRLWFHLANPPYSPFPGGWSRPMDIGGGDASPHSRRLRRMAKAGLVEKRQDGGRYLYRITDAGIEAVRPKP